MPGKSAPAGLLGYLVLLATTSLLAGCSIPYSDHPLSDRKTSTVDERLFGRWLQIDDEPEEKTTADELNDSFEFLTVGLKKSNSKTMMLVYVELDHDGELSVDRSYFFTTKIEDRYYISYEQKDEEKKGLIKYIIATYELDSSGLLTVYLMDNDKLVMAIEQGRVDGEIENQIEVVDGKQKETKTAHLIASPEQLRRFLRETGADYFDSEHPTTYRFLGRQNRKDKP